MSDRPLISYEPNPILSALYDRFFAHIEVDAQWANAVREASARGTIVYILRNVSFIDFLALDHLTKRLGLPRVRFVNDLGLWILEPMGRGWLHALRRRTEQDDASDLQRALAEGSSAVLFLKRPAHLLEGKARGKIEGDTFVRALFELQRASPKPLLLFPQVFLWSKQQDAAKHNPVDALLGPREWPGTVRTIAQFIANYRDVTLRAGDAIDLQAFLNQEGMTALGAAVPNEVLVRRLTYSLLRRLERERRTVIGPTKKPRDRLREEIARSPKLQKVIRDMAGEGVHERTILTYRAIAMIREMEAGLDRHTVNAMAPPFEQITTRMYSGIEVDKAGIERLRHASKDGTLILLPSHKSHFDYMVLTYLFLKHHLQLPLIAAGDNLRFFPLGTLFRRAGAFFIRRSFRGDRLYGAVVDAYIRRTIRDGVSLEFFLEGGRSRTGKLLTPKIGLLSMVVEATAGITSRKVYFCPISIGYERVVEERSYVQELSGAEKKKENLKGLFSSADLFTGRYGKVNVQFGELCTLEGIVREMDGEAAVDSPTQWTPTKRRAIVTRLAYRVMNEINRVTAVTAGSLVATALLTHAKRGLPHTELVALCENLAESLFRFGARFTPSLIDPDRPHTIRRGAIDEACELFVRAGHVEIHRPGMQPESRRRWNSDSSTDAIYLVPDAHRLSLDLSKNILIHFFVSRALCATALIANPGPPVDVETLRERVQTLSRLFKYEFQFRADASFEQIFDEELDTLLAEGKFEKSDSMITVASGMQTEVFHYARLIENFIEGYIIAARSLSFLLRSPLSPKDLLKRAIAQGERMFLAGEISRRESINGPVLSNAYEAFIDQGYLGRTDGKFALPESYASAEAVKTIEGRVAAFQPPRPTP